VSTQQAISLTRPPVNKEELWWSLKALWGVELPRVKVCEGHVAPFDACSWETELAPEPEVSGHYHHLAVKHMGPTTWLQALINQAINFRLDTIKTNH